MSLTLEVSQALAFGMRCMTTSSEWSVSIAMPLSFLPFVLCAESLISAAEHRPVRIVDRGRFREMDTTHKQIRNVLCASRKKECQNA